MFRVRHAVPGERKNGNGGRDKLANQKHVDSRPISRQWANDDQSSSVN